MSRLPIRRPTFDPHHVYLDTPTYGLAADAVVAAMQDALERWRDGVATMSEYDAAVDRSRRLLAECLGTRPERVAVANQVSVFVGLVAASLPGGSTVVAPEGDFTSLLFPLLVQEERGITVRVVALEDLAESIDSSVDVVALSLVQSSDGRVAEIDSIEEAARRHDARLLVDATQAAGWLPFDPGRFDITVLSAYKWLLCPRGSAFMILGDDVPWLLPVFAGWYAGESVWESIYGTPLRLAESARRFDVSPAWLSWIGSAPALEVIAGAGVDAIHRHDLALANRARQGLEMEPSDSAILTIQTGQVDSLDKSGIATARRSGSVRVGFHLYNDTSDVDALVTAVTGGTGHQGWRGSGNGERAPSAPRR